MFFNHGRDDMQETFYRKRGRRYIPVAEYDDNLLRSLPKGHHLVRVDPKVATVHHQIDPDNAAVLAAIKQCGDEAANALYEAIQKNKCSAMDLFRVVEAVVIAKIKGTP